MGRVLEHRRDLGSALRGEFLLDRDDRHAGGTEVLLRAGVEHVELVEVTVDAEDVGGHVGDQRPLHLRDLLELGARNRLVGADVRVSGVVGELPLVLAGHAGGDVLRAVGNRVNRRTAEGRDELGLLEGLARPGALVRVVGDLSRAEEVHRDHRELLAAATLDEDDLVVIANAAEFLESGLRLGVNRRIILAAVGHLHHGHAGSLVIDEIVLDLLQDLERKRSGTRREVICTRHFVNLSTDRCRVYRLERSPSEIIGQAIGRKVYSFDGPFARPQTEIRSRDHMRRSDYFVQSFSSA